MTTNSNSRSTNSVGTSVEDLTKRNVELIRELEEAAKRERRPADRIAEAIARFCGSMKFVWVHVIWFGGWIVFNVIPGVPHIDSFPFTFLTLVVSLEAIFLSTFILISQNHDTRITERRHHLDLQINLLSEQENTKMIAMLEAIAAHVGAEFGHDPHLKALSEQTEPERVVQQIEDRDER